MRREIENWKNPVRFQHGMLGGFCYKRSRENRREREEEPGRKVVTISSQPGCRNSGKNGGRILFQNETRAPRTHEKIGDKTLFQNGTSEVKSREKMNGNTLFIM